WYRRRFEETGHLPAVLDWTSAPPLNGPPSSPQEVTAGQGTIFETLADLLDRENGPYSPGMIKDIKRCYCIHEFLEDYLSNRLARPSGTAERYWIYIALGILGGAKAQEVICSGLLDEVDEFARQGAQDAWELLRNELRSG